MYSQNSPISHQTLLKGVGFFGCSVYCWINLLHPITCSDFSVTLFVRTLHTLHIFLQKWISSFILTLQKSLSSLKEHWYNEFVHRWNFLGTTNPEIFLTINTQKERWYMWYITRNTHSSANHSQIWAISLTALASSNVNVNVLMLYSTVYKKRCPLNTYHKQGKSKLVCLMTI